MKVSITECFSYTQKEVDKKISEVISTANLDKIIKNHTTVLLKVNLLMPKEPDYAITTHPSVVEAVAKLLKDKNCEVLIGDSSSWHTSKALKVTGMEDVAKKTAAKLVNFDSYKPKKVKNNSAKVLKEFFISPPVLDVDYIISLCKLKAHEFTLYTGSVKNMFGCIPGRYKKYIHSIGQTPYKFAECLIDIYSYCKPHFSIMDGIEALEGAATMLGKKRKVNLLLASPDAVSLDTVATHLIGYKPHQLPQNIAARRRHISGSYLHEIEIVAEKELDKLRIKNFGKPPTLRFTFAPFFFFLEPKIYPKLEKDKCIKCGLCAGSCPVEAISLQKQKDDYPKFNYKICIRCYCCSEVCQQAAVSIKVPFFWQMVS